MSDAHGSHATNVFQSIGQIVTTRNLLFEQNDCDLSGKYWNDNVETLLLTLTMVK